MIGWGNVMVVDGVLVSELGDVSGRAPRDRAFRTGLTGELDRMRAFLSLGA